jgi:hypothetical protein
MPTRKFRRRLQSPLALREIAPVLRPGGKVVIGLIDAGGWGWTFALGWGRSFLN